MSEFLLRVARFAERHHKAVLVVTFLLTAVAGLLTARVRFDPDVLGLLPKDDPAVKTFRQTLDEFGGLDLLLVVVRVPEGAVIDPYQQFVNELGESIETLPTIDYAEYRIGEPSELLRTFFPRAFFFLEDAERHQVADRLSEQGISQRVAELRRRLTTPQSLALKELLLLDPLGLSEVFLQRLESGRGALGVDWTSGYYLSKDRRLLLMLVRPKGAAQDIPFGRQLISDVESKIAAAQASWRTRGEDLGDLAATPPDVVLGGSYVTAVSDAGSIETDVWLNSILSMAFVLLLFYITFRRPGLLLYAFVPQTCALLFTFGTFALTGDVLSSATSGCAAMLAGLGVDFVIVSYGRYAEERQRGSAEQALSMMASASGPAVVTGAVTTAVTFFAFGFTKFEGLRQMGLLTGVGILYSMICVLVLLPAMLAWSEARHKRKETTPRLQVKGLGADTMVRLSARYPRATLLIGLALTIAGAAAIPYLRFESSITNLRPQNNPGIAVQAEVSRHFGTNFRYMMLVITTPSLDRTLDLAATAAKGAQEMVRNGDLQRIDSIAALMPSPTRQQEVLAFLAAERAGRLDFDRIRGNFLRELETQGLRPDPFLEGIDLLGRAVNADRPIALDDLDSVEGARRLLARYLHVSDGLYKSVVYLYPEGDRWKSEPPPAAEVLANRLGDEVVLTGVNVLSRSLRKQVWFDAIMAAILGTVMVIGLLWYDLREVRATLLSLAPLVIGTFWIAGAMVLLDLDINFMNIFVATMVIGIGIDYAVHMLHRYREVQAESDEVMVAKLAETARSVAMAALTTVVGFGSLALSHYPGLRSIGYAATLGAALTALIAFTLLPAYLVLVRRGAFEGGKRNKAQQVAASDEA